MRIVHVPNPDGVGGTHHDAGPLQTLVYTMRTEVALRCSMGFSVDVDRIVWTGLQAALAADAAIGIKVDDPVTSPEERPGRADAHARRVRAVIAAQDRKRASRARESPLLDVLDPGAELSNGDLMLGLACHRTRVAANECTVVNSEAVPHLDTAS